MWIVGILGKTKANFLFYYGKSNEETSVNVVDE